MAPTLVLLLGIACYASAFHYAGHEFDRTHMGDAIDKASMKLLKEAYMAAGDKNVIASPLGVFTLLSLYSAGTDGKMKDEIVKAVGLSNYDELFDSYSHLTQKLAAFDPSYFTLANKVYVADEYTISDKFADTAVKSYRSGVEKLNFSDAKAAAATINKWADEKTKGHIKDPVSADLFKDKVAAALFNVIFFQGHWDVPFNASNTKDKDFHVNKKTTVKKPMMQLTQSLFYRDSNALDAKLVELPYKETGFRMVVVLPNKVDGLPSVLEKVTQTGVLADVFELSPAGRDVHLTMPKFDIKSRLDLNSLLPKVGVTKIFTDPASGIVKESPVQVSKAFQEAFVKVDEEGATAGAFTGFVMMPTSSNSRPPPPLDFKVNHPFLFLILHEDTVLFAGTYTH